MLLLHCINVMSKAEVADRNQQRHQTSYSASNVCIVGCLWRRSLKDCTVIVFRISWGIETEINSLNCQGLGSVVEIFLKGAPTNSKGLLSSARLQSEQCSLLKAIGGLGTNYLPTHDGSPSCSVQLFTVRCIGSQWRFPPSTLPHFCWGITCPKYEYTEELQ